MIAVLVSQCLGAALGVFIGVFLGLSIRKRRQGTAEGLLNGSVLLTASAAGGLALLVMMLINYLTGASG